MSWYNPATWFDEKIDAANDGMAWEGNGKTLPDPETDQGGFPNANPLTRSFDLVAYSDATMVEEFDGQFYRNNSAYGQATLKEVDQPK